MKLIHKHTQKIVQASQLIHIKIVKFPQSIQVTTVPGKLLMASCISCNKMYGELVLYSVKNSGKQTHTGSTHTETDRWNSDTDTHTACTHNTPHHKQAAGRHTDRQKHTDKLHLLTTLHFHRIS